MSSSKDHVFVTAATGEIGSGLVRGLIKKEIPTTIYVRNEKKAKELFKNELNTGHLTITIGDYTTVDAYTKAIQGHTRLFLLVAADPNDKPTSMSQIKHTFAKIAFEHGVRQIVDLSSISVSLHAKAHIIAYEHTAAEEKLWALAEENPEQRSLVVLRPGPFMTNHLWLDLESIKKSNKIVSGGSGSAKMVWIDSRDISDCAAAVLSEPVEKHDRNVYELNGEELSNEERAGIFSKVLGRPITYEQQPMEEFYKKYIGLGMSHSFVYHFLTVLTRGTGDTTPQIAIIIGRPLHTLEEWLTENAKAFN